MRTSKIRIALLAVLLVGLLVGPLSAQAQEGDTVVCDSTLITLLYIAEHDFGFHSMMDVSTIDKGQYAPFFDEMMAMMEEGDMEEEDMAEMAPTEEMGDDMSDDMGDMMMLTPGTIEGENAACTELRSELDTFFYTYWTSMMGDEG